MKNDENIVKRTYTNYREGARGWDERCYYGMVAEAYYKKRRETPAADLHKSDSGADRELTVSFYSSTREMPDNDFQEFDDAYFKQFAGIMQEDPLPLKSNEVFDDTYWSHLERWFYLPLNCDNSVYNSLVNFLEYVKAGNLEPFSKYYARGYPFANGKD
jgi:hypothetical protein